MTNVFWKRPPANDLSAWYVVKKEAVNTPPLPNRKYLHPHFFTASEYESDFVGLERGVSILDRLRREMETCQPNVIIPLGGVALWALTYKNKITKSRGFVMKSSLGKWKVLPSLHPAYVLRNYREWGTLQLDLMKAKAESSHPDISLPKREIWIDPTLDEADLFFQQYLRHAPRISVDIETSSPMITCIGFAPSNSHALVVPFVREGCLVDRLRDWITFVQRVLNLPQPKIFQNGMYDRMYLESVGFHVAAPTEDTMLLHHSLQPELQKSLDYLVSIYSDSFQWKSMRTAKTLEEEMGK